jgi:hypothetical protein
MKKFTLVAIALFFSSLLFSQWHFGPRLGLNFSTLSGEGYWGETDHGWIVGRIIGGVATYNLDDHLSLVGEINHITSGGNFKYDYYEESRSMNSNEGQWKEIYSNVQVPIMVKYTIGEDIQFYGEIGPYYSFTFAGRYKDQIEAVNYEDKGKIKYVKEYPDDPQDNTWYLTKEYYRRCDLGMNFGVGAQRELGKGLISVDFRFGLGFLDFNKFPDDEDKPNDYKPYKNRNMALSVAYTFPVGD